MDVLLEQEREYLNLLVAKILAVAPNLVLVRYIYDESSLSLP